MSHDLTARKHEPLCCWCENKVGNLIVGPSFARQTWVDRTAEQRATQFCKLLFGILHNVFSWRGWARIRKLANYTDNISYSFHFTNRFIVSQQHTSTSVGWRFRIELEIIPSCLIWKFQPIWRIFLMII